MPEQNTHDLALELAAFKAEMKADMRALSGTMDDIKSGLVGLGDLRQELATFAVHHEQFKREAQTMWVRIDAQRDEIKKVQETIDQAKGAWRMAGVIASVLGVVGGVVVTWTWAQVQHVPVIIERLNQLSR